MAIADLLERFDDLGKPDVHPNLDPAGPSTAMKKKAKKRGRWKPPPESAKWSDLYSTCSGGIMTSLEVCRDVVGVVKRGDRIHAMTSGWWSMEQPICLIAEQLGPVDMWMATWAVNDDAVLRLVEAIERGFVRNVRAIVDERMKVLRPSALDILQTAIGKGNLGIMACHAKAYVLRQVDGDRAVALVSSANWTQNPRPECVCIDADPRAADVYATWVDRMLDVGKAHPYQHTGKLAEELMTPDVRNHLKAPGLSFRIYPTQQQLSTWHRCRRAWWITYMAGIEPEPSKYAEHGKAVHAQAETYLRGKGPPSEAVAPVVHLLPEPGFGKVEAELSDHDTPLLARMDWVGIVDGILTILDHKTSKKKKREKALRNDRQAMLYAWIAMKARNVDRCRLRWVWYDDQTVTDIEVTLDQADAATATDRQLAAMLWVEPPDAAKDHQNKKGCFTCGVKEACPKLIHIAGDDHGKD